MYTCPMHPEIKTQKKGTCPICGMQLTKEASESTGSQNSYTPLIIIISLIMLVTIALSLKDSFSYGFSLTKTVSYFMAGFFLVFSGFKLLDLKGFAQGYSSYDLLAKRIYFYGYAYPFLELALGLLYLTFLTPPIVTIATFLLMSFSGLGVTLKLIKKEKFQCACLGTFIEVPLTKITLIEDFGTAIMAIGMYLFH